MGGMKDEGKGGGRQGGREGGRDEGMWWVDIDTMTFPSLTGFITH